MAILYKANETDFSHLGLGTLNDAVSIFVTEERNGIFELEMKYPVSGKLFSELKNDRLIKVDAGHKLKDQRFKIIRITKPLDGIVTIYAEHVSYLTQDLALKPKVTFTGNARQALEHWKANLVDDNPFTVWSDITTVGSINWTIDAVENARRALGGVQGSILDVYGGEYQFDNYDIRLLEKRGVKSEALIAYGRNLVDLEQDEEIANTYTSIYPYSIYTDDDGNERMVTLPEYYVDSPYVNNYARRKILAVDFSDEEIETVSALRNAANRYIADNDVGVPKVNLKIKFLDLSKTLDYKHLALLEEVNLCDEVTVYFEKFDINTTAKVIKVVWDALQDRYDSIEVGEARSSLSQAIDTVVDGKVEKTERLSMQAIRTADGKNTIYYGLDEPTGDLKKGDLWFRVVDGEYTRTYRFDGAVWKLVMDMDSNEAKEQAQQAKDDAQQAVDRANQATQQATDAINQAQTAFDEAQQALGTANNAMTQATSAFSLANDAFNEVESLSTLVDENTGEISTIKQSVIGLQTQVSDNAGNISSLTQIAQGLQTQVTDIEGNVSTLQQTAQGLQSSVTNLQDELDGLEIGGRNLLLDSHFYNSSGGWQARNSPLLRGNDVITIYANGSNIGATRFELTIVIKEAGVYTLSAKVKATTGLQFRGFVGATGVNTTIHQTNNEWTVISTPFKVAEPEKEVTIRLYLQDGSAGQVASMDWAKLEKGNKATDWTPAPEDIDHQFSVITQTIDSITSRVGDAEGNITALQQTSSSLAARLTDAEGNITSLTATVSGLQTTVSNVQGDVSSVTQIANALQVRMTNAEGDISTLTQTASSLQSTIKSVRDDLDGLEISEINLISNSNQRITSTSYLVKEYFINEDFVEGESYTVIIKGSINDGQQFGLWQNRGTHRRGLFDDLGNGLFRLTFDSRATTSGNERRIRIYNYPSDGASSATIEWIKFVRGNKTSLNWTPAPEDMATQSQITQLSDAINLRVVKGDVINQINLDTSGILISGKKLILDGDTTVTGTFRVGNANITSLDAGKLTSGTLDAGKISVINLSANSIVGGILQSHNSNTTFNLNTGNVSMENATLTLGGGATIKFTDAGNKITYSILGPNTYYRTAGMGVGRVLGNDLPFAYLGTTPGGDLNTLDSDYSGLMVHTTYHIRNNGAANSISGGRFSLRNRAVNWDKGVTFDFYGDPTISMINGSTEDYTIGPLYKIVGKQSFNVQNYYNGRSGWFIETNYAGDGTAINIRGQYPTEYNYSIGTGNRPIDFIYAKSFIERDNSDIRLKQDISDNVLGLDFIKSLETVEFRFKLTNADIKQGIKQHKKQFGLIAQQVRDELIARNVDIDEYTLIEKQDDGYYSLQYQQLITPTIKAVQELDLKVESVKDDVEWLKLENQYLRQKVEQLEEMIA